MTASVVLVCGPSGSGKTHIAEKCGLPVFRLDDFYKDGDDPSMPRSAELGIIDWDDPRAWRSDEALTALVDLCRDGSAEVPTYDMGQDRTTGTSTLRLEGHGVVVAEGVFAAELVDACRGLGILADAVVLHRSPWKNFVRRFTRDLRERRKPPLTLWRRGRLLMRDEPRLVADATAKGCRPVSAHELAAVLLRLAAGARA
ncbi:MAG: ATP-binding protein [Actinomycetales bacterium]|nr:ATP-binding protein [Actinomycetales bacterium]